MAHGSLAALSTGAGPRDLRSLFLPKSIAVVGASAADGKAGNALMRSLASFPGPVHPVNPRAREIAGLPCASSVTAVADPVDLAILAVPAAVVPAALEDCGRAGVRAAVVCAGGFAESPGGAALQDEVVRTARRHNIRVLGPNTSGFVSPAEGTFATFVSSAAYLLPGSVSIVARSGGVNLAACFQAANGGVGIRLGIGMGNAAELSFPEVLDFLAEDQATAAVGLHLEGIGDGRELCAAVARLTERKPVVALKVGRAPIDEFAQSHTGALLGDFELAVAALAQSGAVVVDDLVELVDALSSLSVRRLPPKRDPGVAIVTAQAGPGLIMADSLAMAGVAVPELDEHTVELVSDLLPPLTWIRNPVDTGRPGATFPSLLACVAKDPQVDVLAVYALDEPDAVQPAQVLADSGVLRNTPVIFGTGGPAAAIAASQARLADLGVPVFAEPRRAARAARAVAIDASARWRLRSARLVPAQTTPLVTERLDEHAAKLLLGELGILTPERRLCSDHASAYAALSELGGPVVAKIASTLVLHKSDVGGVHHGIHTQAQMAAALAAIDSAPVAGPVRYLIERQAPAGPEVLIGGIRDASFGPVVALSLGGVDVELIGRPALRLAPVSSVEAEAMVAALPSALLAGHRGAPPIDSDRLAQIILAVSQILASSPAVTQIDLNPVRATQAGPVVLDALVLCN